MESKYAKPLVTIELAEYTELQKKAADLENNEHIKMNEVYSKLLSMAVSAGSASFGGYREDVSLQSLQAAAEGMGYKVTIQAATTQSRGSINSVVVLHKIENKKETGK